jgi:hypothetical protein
MPMAVIAPFSSGGGVFVLPGSGAGAYAHPVDSIIFFNYGSWAMQLDRNGLLPKGLLFSVAGARGIVGESLDAGVVARLAGAFSSILPPGAVVVGRDTRPSGVALLLRRAGIA